MSLSRSCFMILMICLLFAYSACDGSAEPLPADPVSVTNSVEESSSEPAQFSEAPAPLASGELQARFPAYFELATFKGLELYMWKTGTGEWACGLMMGTNRNKTADEQNTDQNNNR